MYGKLLQACTSRAITATYYSNFDEILYGWSLVIKLHCGENHSQIAATEIDLWPLVARTRQPW